MSIGQADMNAAMNDARSELDKLIGKVDEYFGAIQNDTDLQASWEGALDDLRGSLSETGLAWNYLTGDLDLSTEAGRAQWEAFKDAGEAAIDFGKDVRDQGGSVEDATNAANLYAQGLREKLIREMGLTAEQADKVLEKMGLMPDQVKTAFEATGLAEAEERLIRVKGLMDSVGSFGEIGGKFTFGIGKRVAAGVTKPDGARAAGGPVGAGMTYLVGERGPELLTMGGSGHVTDATTTKKALGGTTVNNYFEGVPIEAQLDQANRRMAATLAGAGVGG
jgi:uncharacterized protein YjbJ (UPF0337 family)